MSTAISFHQVSRVFGDFTALDSVTFDVPTGSIFGVVGTSGAGKWVGDSQFGQRDGPGDAAG